MASYTLIFCWTQRAIFCLEIIHLLGCSKFGEKIIRIDIKSSPAIDWSRCSTGSTYQQVPQ